MLNKNRIYIDKIVEFINSIAAEKHENGELVTEAYLKSEEFASTSFQATKALCTILRYTVPSEIDFDLYLTIAIAEYISNHPIVVEASSSLVKNHKRKTWLTENRNKEISWNYTERYLSYLKINGRSEKIIDEIFNSSKSILEKLGDPKSNQEFFVKGLVVGSVQSGKTGNFNAVINRAIDSGYALIIVLAGIMEDLRSQTQARIEKEVSGTGISDGVGNLRRFGEMGDPSVHQVILPTSVKHDFKKTIAEADFSLNNKNILVCKKNVGVLKNLILWLDKYLIKNKDKHDIPLLIIDDEADNASLNNMGSKGKEYASKINGNLRALLGLFTRKSYIGYTATPFANVLQDRNEVPDSKWKVEYKESGIQCSKEFELVGSIFPEDFIELLFPPSNYIGAKHFFETRIEEVQKIDPLVCPPVNDHLASFPIRVDRSSGEAIPANSNDPRYPKASKDDLFPRTLPPSLKEAIQCFILSIAIRLSRKSIMINSKLYNHHSSMLIHISRYTSWQIRTKKLVDEYVNDILVIRLRNDLPNSIGSIYEEFERTWYKYYAHIINNIKSYLPFEYDDPFLIPKKFHEDIKPLLVESVTNIDIKAINSETKDSLDYSTISKKIIAIGGNRLSRGFTLEGLTINYFIRNTDYADTLLQMGRWFGYRPGYLDCCKLFTTMDSIDKFDLTTITIEELEQEFKIMRKMKRTPSDFLLRVKTHPKVLKITRAPILKNTVSEKVDFSGSVIQSTQFNIDKKKIENAWKEFTLLCKKTKWENHGQGFFINKTNTEGLMKFLNLENTFKNFDIQCLPEWLKLCNESGKLLNWTVAIKTNVKSNNPTLENCSDIFPSSLKLTIRRGPMKGTPAWESLIRNNIFKASGKSAQLVATGEDFSITLSKKQKLNAEKAFREEKISEWLEKDSSQKISDLIKKAADISSVPEKAYRQAMEETDGILLIYLVSTEHIFEYKNDTESDLKLKLFCNKMGLDKSIPLVGYALGFPKISGNIGGTYIRGDFELDPIDSEDEFDENLIIDED